MSPAAPPLTLCVVLSSRDRRDRHRSKSRDSSSRGDKSVTIQTPGEPLLDAESTRGDDRVSHTASFAFRPLLFVEITTIVPEAYI